MITGRYWIQDRGWYAEIEHEGVANFTTIAQVPLSAVERLEGGSYGS